MYVVCYVVYFVLYMFIRFLCFVDFGNFFVMMDCRRFVNEMFLVDCFNKIYSKFILIVLKIYNIFIKVIWFIFMFWIVKKI